MSASLSQSGGSSSISAVNTTGGVGGLLADESIAGADAYIAPARWARARIVAEALDAGTLRRYVCIDIPGLEPRAYASEWIAVADSRIAPLGIFTMSSLAVEDVAWRSLRMQANGESFFLTIADPEAVMSTMGSPLPLPRSGTATRLAATIAAILRGQIT